MSRCLPSTLARLFPLTLLLAALLCPSRFPDLQGAATPQAETLAASSGAVREPAVAGLFYPKGADELDALLTRLLKEAAPPVGARLRAIICPHAGYIYSGPTAATAYRLVGASGAGDVLVMGASHHAWFEGVSVLKATAYRTPLGLTTVSPLGATLASKPPFHWEAPCRLQRPTWWRSTGKSVPEGEDTPETWEHSVEVQVPFLQKVLPKVTVTSVLFGDADPAAAARVLAQAVGERTLIVVSTDLSHYHPYDEAKRLDQRCVEAICRLDTSGLSPESACGRGPVLALLHLAKAKDWRARLLDYRNSGDTSGDRQRVVGYAAIAFESPAAGALESTDKAKLLQLARSALRESVANGPLPQVETNGVSAALLEPRACFVTLTQRGALRGCIGHLLPQRPLYQAVMENARNAALHDSRFPPVRTEEVRGIHLEISVLTEPRRLAFTSPADLLQKLQPHRDGVVLRLGMRSATYLPQVWEQLPDREQFLGHLAEKAGLPASAWRDPQATFLTYQVESFEE